MAAINPHILIFLDRKYTFPNHGAEDQFREILCSADYDPKIDFVMKRSTETPDDYNERCQEKLATLIGKEITILISPPGENTYYLLTKAKKTTPLLSYFALLQQLPSSKIKEMSTAVIDMNEISLWSPTHSKKTEERDRTNKKITDKVQTAIDTAVRMQSSSKNWTPSLQRASQDAKLPNSSSFTSNRSVSPSAARKRPITPEKSTSSKSSLETRIEFGSTNKPSSKRKNAYSTCCVLSTLFVCISLIGIVATVAIKNNQVDLG